MRPPVELMSREVVLPRNELDVVGVPDPPPRVGRILQGPNRGFRPLTPSGGDDPTRLRPEELRPAWLRTLYQEVSWTRMGRLFRSGIDSQGSFTHAYWTWREQSFPLGSPTDAVDELHADLVLADAWVAETLIPFVEDGVYEPAKVDVSGELQALRDRARALRDSSSKSDKGLLNAYIEYSRLLEVAYEGFLAQAPR